MDNIRNNKMIVPLRYKWKGAPPSEALDKLMKLQAELTNNKNEKIQDGDMRERIRAVGIVPVFKGRLKGRHLDIDRTLVKINEEINKISKKSGYSLDATKAMQYYALSENTMYAYDQGDSLDVVVSSMPKRDRDYFNEFVEASDKEKVELLDLLPKYMRRPLEASWGLKVEKKDDIVKYFQKNNLPDNTWRGWDEDVDLNVVKTKMAKNEQIEFSDSNIWSKDIDAANNAGSIPIPKLGSNEGSVPVQNKLRGLFTKFGYSDIQYNARNKSCSEDINLYLKYDMKSRYVDEIEGKFGRNI